MKWAESEIHPNTLCRTKSEASWLLRDSPCPSGSAVQSARSTHLKSRSMASRIVDSTQTLEVQPVKTRYCIKRPRRISYRSVP